MCQQRAGRFVRHQPACVHHQHTVSQGQIAAGFHQQWHHQHQIITGAIGQGPLGVLANQRMQDGLQLQPQRAHFTAQGVVLGQQRLDVGGQVGRRQRAGREGQLAVMADGLLVGPRGGAVAACERQGIFNSVP